MIVHGIGGHQLALVDDDDLLAGLLDFRQDVRAQNNGVSPARPLIRSRVSLICLGSSPAVAHPK